MQKISLIVVAMLSGLSAIQAGAASPDTPATNGKASAPSTPLDGLKQGDSAEKIKKLLGDPVETRPMKAPTGKAEVWVYTKEISRRVDRIDQSTPDVVISVTESDGSIRQKITPGQVRFTDVHYVMEEVTEVLLFNDHYVLHKVNRLERKL